MNSASLAWRLLRGGGRRGLLGAGLMVAAVAAATALLLASVAANVAFDGRADRQAWREPDRASQQDAVATQAGGTDFYDGRPIQIVDLAARPGVDRADLPTPPGAETFPEPGQMWVSPALADLLERAPDDELADRFDGVRTVGQLGQPGLVHGAELVAVVGHASGDPAMHGERSDFRTSAVSPTPVAAFAGKPSSVAIAYQVLAAIATVLVLVPLLVFGGAAARLTVARRDQRLATLRLVGATPGQVTSVTAIEAVLTALVGAILGAGIYLLGMPGLTRIEIAGGTWFLSDVWVGVLPLLAVVLAVPLLVGISAIAGLRRVVVSPLGVARRHTPAGLRAIRLVAFVAAVATALTISQVVGGNLGIALFIAMMGLSFLGLNLVGPWLLGLLGRAMAALSRRPAMLLAGRRLTDDPRAAWRTVAGVALVGFVAGFTTLMNPTPSAVSAADQNTLQALVPVREAPAVITEAKTRLDGVPGVDPSSITTTAPGEGEDSQYVRVPVSGETRDLEQARTALAGLLPGRPFITAPELDDESQVLVADLRTGSITVLVATFLLGVVSAGIAAASSVLDRRQTLALLRLAGTPMSVLDAARRRETLLPLLVMGGGSLLSGIVLATPFAAMMAPNLTAVLTLGAVVVFGFFGVWLAGELSRPLLRSVTEHASPRPD